jgi:hypothetical protein
MAERFNISGAVARLEREANEAAGLEELPEFDPPKEYATIAEAEAALSLKIPAKEAPSTYKADADGFNVRPSDRCATPAPWGATCTSAQVAPLLKRHLYGVV